MKVKKEYGRVTTLRIPKDLWEILEEEANYNFTSVSSVVLKAVAFYLESRGKYERQKPGTKK